MTGPDLSGARLRAITTLDAAEFVALNVTLAAEPLGSVLTAQEANIPVDTQVRLLAELEWSEQRTVYVAEVDGTLAGYVAVSRGLPERQAHVCAVMLGVLPAYRNRGIGRGLLDIAERWAVARGLRRMELSVAAPNRAALRLYLGAGFRIEGVKRAAVRVDTAYVDELWMAKCVGDSACDLPLAAHCGEEAR